MIAIHQELPGGKTFFDSISKDILFQGHRSLAERIMMSGTYSRLPPAKIFLSFEAKGLGIYLSGSPVTLRSNDRPDSSDCRLVN
jgi:hypothetical protein